MSCDMRDKRAGQKRSRECLFVCRSASMEMLLEGHMLPCIFVVEIFSTVILTKFRAWSRPLGRSGLHLLSITWRQCLLQPMLQLKVFVTVLCFLRFHWILYQNQINFS